VKFEISADDAINKVYLVDKIFVKGVSADRSKNDTNLDYVQSKEFEALGIRQYIHKFHLGLQPYYFKKQFEQQLKKYTDEEAKKDPQAFFMNT